MNAIDGSAAVSRRQLLRGAAIVAGSATVFAVAVTPAEAAKSTQEAAGYQGMPKDGASCSTCALFQPPNACTLVDGAISPNAWCHFYTKKS